MSGMNFGEKLIAWYLDNKRDLPWRQTRDPYKIWLSEIILQQTRVEQGKPYYFKFVEQYPTVDELAAASEEEVLKLWQGLGYYSRARNLLSSARQVSRDLGGVFPDSHKELMKLKGIGDYTASAIASVCFDEPVAAVDGNVFRVLSRIYGIATPTNSTSGSRAFKELAQELVAVDDPGNFNQGLIEFGSEHCKPRQPLCKSCIFQDVCVAHSTGRVQELPVKIKKQKPSRRHFNYIICLSDQEETLIRRREGKGIWQGLYEFPLIESDSEREHPTALDIEGAFQWDQFSDKEDLVLLNQDPIVHKLTHQHIYTKFWMLRCRNLPEPGIPFASINNFPVPVLIEKFINTFDF